jgi:hypothetical protein
MITMNRQRRAQAARRSAEDKLAGLRLRQLLIAEAIAPRWTRAEDGHPRWEIKNPSGDGRNYLMTDEAIRTFGRRHMTELMINLPPLPEEAWTPPARKEVTITTNHETETGICDRPGSNGGVCGLVSGHREPHRPVHVLQKPEPIRTPQEMTGRYPGMTLEQAMTLLAEADQAHAGDQAETLGVFIKEERDPFTRALIRGQRCKVTRQADGTYQVTVTDEVAERRKLPGYGPDERGDEPDVLSRSTRAKGRP